jgi:hypothetical protein
VEVLLMLERNFSWSPTASQAYPAPVVSPAALLTAGVAGGHIPVLEHLVTQRGLLLFRQLCEVAASKGRLEALQWLWQHRCVWAHALCETAGAAGHLPIVQWARQQGCEWGEAFCSNTARAGMLHVLQWARQAGCPMANDTCAAAAQGGQMAVLRWAFEVCGCPLTDLASEEASARGDLPMLCWLHLHGAPVTSRCFIVAARNGRLELMRWLLREVGAPADYYIAAAAYDNLHWDVLRLAVENGCPVLEAANLYYRAAQHGNLPVLQWARQRGLDEWDTRAAIAAASAGHLHVLSWLYESRAPWNPSGIRVAASRWGHLHVLQWLREQEPEIAWGSECAEVALARRQWEVLRWLLQQGYPAPLQAADMLTRYDDGLLA